MVTRAAQAADGRRGRDDLDDDRRSALTMRGPTEPSQSRAATASRVKGRSGPAQGGRGKGGEPPAER
ncbi:hypothetical protein UK12_17765 [Saccharothrix sp. ST-888]|nr:hypothetical protein UK12_17765 [Saccharothrix sp. ST-888]